MVKIIKYVLYLNGEAAQDSIPDPADWDARMLTARPQCLLQLYYIFAVQSMPCGRAVSILASQSAGSGIESRAASPFK